VYGWYLLLLATIQVRFVGELAMFATLFAGLGFVHLAQWVDVSRPPAPFDQDVDGRALPNPDRRQVGAIITLFLLVGGLGIIQTPVKTSQLTISEERYETAVWMGAYATEHDWEYPQNYVFSPWSYNRVYNYFVSGESRSYGFAQRQYEPFATSTSPTDWYERLRDRTGFIVYDANIKTPVGSVGERLGTYGSRTNNTPGLANYRAVYASDDERYRVFTLVPGATITGSAEPNTSVQLSTEVDIGGTSFTYKRQAQASADGTYSVTVAYPGTYAVDGNEVTVSTQAVENGKNVSV
jgi:dolichyl-diphosphooligosaccharide--protein glycosyltransferase